MDYVFQFREVLRYWPWLLHGVGVTIAISVISMVFCVFLGTAGAVARRSRYRVLRWAMIAYIDLIRNTPFLVQLFILFFGLPSVGIRLDAMAAGVLGIVIYNTAFTTEIIRAGLQAIHRSQIEAGLSIGMTRFQIFIYVVILPAIEKVYPSLISQFVLLMLGTSIVSAIGVEELTSYANQIQTINFRSIEVYLVVICIYMALTLLVRFSMRSLGLVLFSYRRRRGARITQEAN
jgi:polar amino acid transport system permease protein